MNIVTARKALIGKTVGLDGIENTTEHFEIVGVSREIIEFDKQKDNNFKIQIEGAESYFIHSTAIIDFVNGVDTSAHLKSNYKGGTIVLIDVYSPEEGEKFARKCDATGEGMNEGYVFGDGEKYFKYDKDATKEAEKFYDSLQDSYDDDNHYWTTWEQDFQYIFTNGKLIEIED